MRQNKATCGEAGRSMVEMLGVLAVMGVLTMVSIVGINYMRDKYKANEIIRDAHMTYVSYESTQQVDKDWKAIEFKPKVDLDFFYRHDPSGYFLVKVDQVESSVCDLLVQGGLYPNVIFMNEKKQKLTECPDISSNMLIMFLEGEGALTPCEKDEDCPEQGFCQVNTGFCKVCREGYRPDNDRLGCIKDCAEAETVCMMDELGWCCPDSLICGDGLGECIESDGFCSYEVTRNVLAQESNCSYEVVRNIVEQKSNCSYEVLRNTVPQISNCSYQVSRNVTPQQSNCSYRISRNVTPQQSNCSYRIPEAGKDTDAALEKIKGCGAGEYCALAYSTEECSSWASHDRVGEIYGFCHKWEDVNHGCQVLDEGEDVMTQIKGCGVGEYCALAYSAEDCSSWASHDRVGEIYGSCQPWEDVNHGCQVLDEGEDVVTQIKGCGAGEYCALAYTKEDCSSWASHDRVGTIYGSCQSWDDVNHGCQVLDDGADNLKALKKCGAGEYCALTYSREDCSSWASHDRVGIVYGNCYPWEEVNQGCTVVGESEEHVKVKKGCGAGEYCALAYSREDCSSWAGHDRVGTIYGNCYPWEEVNRGCHVTDDEFKESVIGKQKCPETQYCSLQWRNQECGNAGHDHLGTIYGVCVPKDQNTQYCPYL